MSFHNKTLLVGGGSASGAPLTLGEEKETERMLGILTADPINSIFEDREFKMFKTKQFQRAFPGKQQLDAAGRGIDTPPVVREVEPFKPTLRRDDLNISGAVGEDQRNRPSEVIKAKKALSNTGLFDFDVTKEKSTDAGPLFTDATKAFQRLNGIEADGCIRPGCPTHKALGELFFPEGGSSKATPVDLRPAAARAEAAATGAGSRPDGSRPTLGGEGLIFTPEDEAGMQAEPTVPVPKPPAENSDDENINWKQEESLPPGSRDSRQFKTKGPVKVIQSTTTFGVDGVRYQVDWLPLDKSGNVIPEFRSPGFRPQEFGGHVLPFTKPESIIKPPYDNPHGFQVTIRVPPQAAVHGNSAGVSLDIFSSE